MLKEITLRKKLKTESVTFDRRQTEVKDGSGSSSKASSETLNQREMKEREVEGVSSRKASTSKRRKPKIEHKR